MTTSFSSHINSATLATGPCFHSSIKEDDIESLLRCDIQALLKTLVDDDAEIKQIAMEQEFNKPKSP